MLRLSRLCLAAAAAVYAPSVFAQAPEARPSAGALISEIAAGRTTAETAINLALDGIGRWAVLNGLARSNAEAALAAAREIDTARAAGQAVGPLAGLPIVVKDNIQVKGLPAAAGTPGLAGVVSAANAPVLQKLVAAGAIPIATTNMHELAFGISGYNPTYQTGPEPGVRSPYDRSRSAGGSSSGTGALVGAGVVRAGLGTDTGGSVRLPAAINGVAGLRPTVGRYPGEAIVPISHTRDTAGLIAARVGDIELMDRVIAGGAPATKANLTGLRLGLATVFTSGLDVDTADAFTKAVAKLKAAGAILVDVDTQDLAKLNGEVSFPIALYEAYDDLVAYLAKYAPGVAVGDVVKSVKSPDVKGTYEGLVVPRKLPGAQGLVDGKPVYDAAMSKSRPALMALYARIFRDNNIEALIFPTLPQVAVKATPESSSPEVFGAVIRNTDPGSNAGLPGLTLPVGRGAATGMPMAVELDGPSGSDRRLIEIALALEGIFGTVAPPAAP